MIDARTRSFVVIVATIVGALAVLGLGGAFTYALIAGRVTVPESAANGFWAVVVGLLTLASTVLIPLARDWFARSQRQLTQDKIDQTNAKIDTISAQVASTQQVALDTHHEVLNGLSRGMADMVRSDAAGVAAQLATEHPLGTPVVTALKTNSDALADATVATEQLTAAMTEKDGGPNL